MLDSFWITIQIQIQTIRLNLVEDYFEIYLPIYSNLGWEIGQPNYDQFIRFKFTVDPQVLLGLFRRKWY